MGEEAVEEEVDRKIEWVAWETRRKAEFDREV